MPMTLNLHPPTRSNSRSSQGGFLLASSVILYFTVAIFPSGDLNVQESLSITAWRLTEVVGPFLPTAVATISQVPTSALRSLDFGLGFGAGAKPAARISRISAAMSRRPIGHLTSSS